jgi:hypothetical protein
MEAVFAFRCSENETVEDAAGKTMAVDKYNGVIRTDTTIETIVAAPVKRRMNFRFIQMNCMKSFLFSAKSVGFCDINYLFSGAKLENQTVFKRVLR